MLVRLVRRISALLLVLASASCAHHQKDPSVCPEYRGMRCTAGSRCSMDRARGCRVCQCTPNDQPVEQSPDSNALPPQ